MNKKTEQQKTPVYIRTNFRCDPGVLGRIQHLLIDENIPVSEVAQRYGLSVSTVYKMKAAVPAEFVSSNPIAHSRFRSRHKDVSVKRNKSRRKTA